MKRNLLIILQLALALLVFMSCGILFQDTITGNGKVITERREIGEFRVLDVTSGLEVTIVFGENPSLEIEADENLMEVIKTDLRNDQLKIYTSRNIRRAKSKKIHLTVPRLNSIEVSGAAIVSSQNTLKTDDLDVEVSSAGKLILKAETGNVQIEVSSAAKLILTAETGNVQIEVSSAALAELMGSANELEAEVSSAGKLKAGELISRHCRIEVSSAGHAEVNAQDELDAEASSAGSVSYTGAPKVKRIETSSAGSVSEK